MEVTTDDTQLLSHEVHPFPWRCTWLSSLCSTRPLWQPTDAVLCFCPSSTGSTPAAPICPFAHQQAASRKHPPVHTIRPQSAKQTSNSFPSPRTAAHSLEEKQRLGTGIGLLAESRARMTATPPASEWAGRTRGLYPRIRDTSQPACLGAVMGRAHDDGDGRWPW